MRFFLALLVVASLGVSSTASAADIAALGASARRSVVRLAVLDRSGEEIASGTGFFVSKNGRIVTNHHVIEDAERMQARLDGGRKVPIVGVLATDKVRDLAVLQAAPGTYTPLPLGTSAKLQPGDQVIVIGSPVGYSTTLSSGIIAAVRPEGIDDAGLHETHTTAAWTIQFTAAISPGSSGSPVITLDGKVVGVAVGEVTAGQGLNFGIAVDAVKNVLAHTPPGTPVKSFDDVDGEDVHKNLLISAVGIGAAALLVFIATRLAGRRARRAKA